MLETRSIIALGDARRQWTDAAGRTLSSFDELDKATVFTYDASGNQLSVWDPNNVGEDVVYDALGLAGLRTDTNSDTTNSGYDDAGNRISATDGKSNTTSYSYDARSRQVKQTDRLSGEAEFAYTATGQLASLTDAEDQTTSYTYDDAGNKLTETYPDHVVSSTVGQTGYGIISFTYDPAGRVDVRTDQQGDTCTYDYDLAGRLTSQAYVGRTGGPLSGQGYSDSFTYDSASRMLTAVSGGYSNTVTYTYADVGSDTTIDVTYKWDALGRRVYRDDGTSPRVFVRVGQQTIADYGAGIAASTPKYRYVYASYIDEPVLRYEPSATETPPNGIPIQVATGHPWSSGLGTVTLTPNFSCTECKLCWSVILNYTYQLDPRNRSWWAEIKTRLVNAADLIGRCGWKEYEVRGSAAGGCD